MQQESITNAEIESTETFKKLEKVFQTLLLKPASKKTISHGLLVHKTTGVIPGSIGGNALRVLTEIIHKKSSDKVAS